MQSSFDYYKRIESPEMYLCNPDQRFLCALTGENRTLTLRFNDLSELSFTVPKIEGTEGNYNLIESKRLIFVDKIGWFQISTVTETVEGDTCSKRVVAKSHQTVFSDRGFVSEDRVYMFYNPNDPLDEHYESSNALAIPSVVGQLHQQLGIRVALNNSDIEPSYDRKDWTLIYIDPILKFRSRSYSGMYEPADDAENICRSFDADTDGNGYDFMVNKVEEAFEVIFEFDFLYHTIKVKTLEDITKPTSIYLSFQNVINSIDIKENSEDIVTVMTCEGNDLDIRTVNPMGTNYIVDFSYYKKLINDDGVEYPWMSKALIDALNDWEVEFEKWRVDDTDRTGHTKGYSTLVKEIQELYVQKSQSDADIQYANLKLTDMQAARDQYLNEDDKPLDGSGYVTAESVKAGGRSMLPKSRFHSTDFTDTTTIVGHVKGAKATKVEDDDEGKSYHYEFAFEDEGTSGTPRSFIDTYIDSDKIEDNANVPFYFMDEDNRSYCKLTVESEVGVVKDADGFIAPNGTVEVRGVTFSVTSLNGAYTVTLPNGNTINASQSNSYFVYDGTRYRIISGADGIVTVYGFYIKGFDRYTTYAETRGDDGWCAIWEEHINRDLTPINEALQEDIGEIEEEMEYICEQCNIQKYIKRRGDELYDELSVYWIEGTYSNNNFATYDTSTMADMIDLANELMDAAKVDLKKSSQPQFTMTVDSINFIKILEFKQFTDELNLGRVITIEREDGVYYRPALMSLEYDLDATETFTMTFSNASRPGDTSMTFADLIKESSTTARTVASNWSNLTDYSRNKASLTNLILSPLDRTLRAANNNMASQAFIIDDTGILGRKYSDESDTGFSPKQMRILNNLLMFTDDNWTTAKTALGNILYEHDGEVREAYGLVAEVLVGSLLLGETMRISNEANTISLDQNGITIKKKYKREEDGAEAVDMVFEADTNGNLKVVGDIFANSLTLADGVTIKYTSIDGAPDLDNFVTIENGHMKTGNYAYSGGVYAQSGMCIDFENQFIRAENFSVDSTGSLNARSGNVGALQIETLQGNYGETEVFSGEANVSVTIPRGTIGMSDGTVWYGYSAYKVFSLAELGITDNDVVLGELSIDDPSANQYRQMFIGTPTAKSVEMIAYVQTRTSSLTMDQTLTCKLSFKYYKLKSTKSEYALIHTADNTFNIEAANNKSVLTISDTRINTADIFNLRSYEATIGGIHVKGGVITSGGRTIDLSDDDGDNYSATVGFAGNTIMVYVSGGIDKLPVEQTFDIWYKDSGSDFYKSTQVTVSAGSTFGKVELPIFDIITEAVFPGGYTYTNFRAGARNISISGCNVIPGGYYNSTYSCWVGGSLGDYSNRWSGLFAINIGSSYYPIKNIYGEQIYQNGEQITSSDRSLKNSIEYMDDTQKLSEFFDALKPATFKYNDGASGRRHMGLIAQDVQESLKELGISETDNAVFCSWQVPNGEGEEIETCGIRYGELIPLAIHEIQELKKKIKVLENELKEKKGEVEE